MGEAVSDSHHIYMDLSNQFTVSSQSPIFFNVKEAVLAVKHYILLCKQD